MSLCRVSTATHSPSSETLTRNLQYIYIYIPSRKIDYDERGVMMNGNDQGVGLTGLSTYTNKVEWGFGELSLGIRDNG